MNNHIAEKQNSMPDDDFLARVQKEDSRNKNLIKSVLIMYLICTVFYAALFIINPDPELSIYDRLGGIFYVAAFSLGSLYFLYEYRTMKKIDYSLPIKLLLIKTEKRYRFCSLKWIPIIIVVILIDAGISFSFANPERYDFMRSDLKLFYIQLVYWFIMIVSGFIGYIIWRKRSLPIWKNAKAMLKELDS